MSRISSLRFLTRSCRHQRQRHGNCIATLVSTPSWVVAGPSITLSNSYTTARISPRPLATTTVACNGKRMSQIVRFMSNGKDLPAHTLFPMPALSPTMESGTIASWSKTEGDSFSAGDVLCTIETDKASVDFEAQDEGVLAKILRDGPTAVDLPIGTPICVVVEEASDVPAFADFVVDDEAAAAAATPTATDETPGPPAAAAAISAVSPSAGTPGTSLLLPSARHLSQSKGLDATVLTGSGKGGRVTKGDVIAAIQAGTLPPLPASINPASVTAATETVPETAAPVTSFFTPGAPPVDLPLPLIESNGPTEDFPNNKMRKIIASRLTESKRDVPHFYTSMNVALDAVLNLRKKLTKEHDVKVSVNDFIIKASAMALRDVPEVNGTYNDKTQAVQLSSSVDISVAVATPTGLITPIVFNTDKRGLADITDTVKDLATRARDGKLAPHEYQGGTFSISNLGMFGIQEFSAVINPPQAAILAVGGGSRTVVPTPYVMGAEKQAPPTIATLLTARLSADRRVVDEATAALFTGALRHYLEEPSLLML